MTRKPVKHGPQENGLALPRSPAGGLTCSEGQVDEVLSAGESTEEERSLSTDTPPIQA